MTDETLLPQTLDETERLKTVKVTQTRKPTIKPRTTHATAHTQNNRGKRSCGRGSSKKENRNRRKARLGCRKESPRRAEEGGSRREKGKSR